MDSLTAGESFPVSTPLSPLQTFEQIQIKGIKLPGPKKGHQERILDTGITFKKEELEKVTQFALQVPHHEGKRNLALVCFRQECDTVMIENWVRNHAFNLGLTDDILAVAGDSSCQKEHSQKTIVAIGSRRPFGKYYQALRLYSLCGQRNLGPISTAAVWGPNTWFLIYDTNLPTLKAI